MHNQERNIQKATNIPKLNYQIKKNPDSISGYDLIQQLASYKEIKNSLFLWFLIHFT